ncbi:type VII secretion target [Actinoplanes aureus]|uniref:Uncharacterized protein n=1 Tax=Actinoplanes aureus TaxID=2792083 RepID=A0A931CCI3_9ACTN|nr:type VII secretion target [Actinoplanes aureus]MBG0564937.1 hypothetical protein [Actinoplanes aureus]
MTFEVEPHALRQFASRLQDTYDDAGHAKIYVEAHGTFSLHQGGLMGFVLNEHAKIMDALREMIARLSRLSVESEDNLRRIAQMYEDTDRKNAASFDATLPSSPRPIIFEG